MLQGYYSVLDKKAQRYYQPQLFRSDIEALRLFDNCVLDPDHQFGKNPEDYAIYKIATFDEETGVIEKQTPTSLSFRPEIKVAK